MKTLKLKFKGVTYKIKVYTIDTSSNYNVSGSLHDESGVLCGSSFREETTNDELKAFFKGYLTQRDKGVKCETCQWYHHEPSILGGTAECMRGVKPLNTFIENEACEDHSFTWVDKLKGQNDFYDEHLSGAIKLNK